MTEEQKKDIRDLMEAVTSSDGRVVIGQVVGTQHNYFGPTSAAEPKVEEKALDQERLARAIENCQSYFWANAAYAVVFCICRDDYKKDITMASFERMVELLPYTKKRSYTCPPGTIANAFSDNPIFNKPIDNWDAIVAKDRIIKLRDKLRIELKLYEKL